MNELVNHPEWMPLLLDENGEAREFKLSLRQPPDFPHSEPGGGGGVH